MLTIQLHALDATGLVDLEAVCDAHAGAAAQQRILRGSTDVPKGNRFDGFAADGLPAPFPALRTFELHFQMLAADDSRIQDLEISVEDGLRKPLSPRAGAAQNARGVERELGATSSPSEWITPDSESTSVRAAILRQRRR